MGPTNYDSHGTNLAPRGGLIGNVPDRGRVEITPGGFGNPFMHAWAACDSGSRRRLDYAWCRTPIQSIMTHEDKSFLMQPGLKFDQIIPSGAQLTPVDWSRKIFPEVPLLKFGTVM